MLVKSFVQEHVTLSEMFGRELFRDTWIRCTAVASLPVTHAQPLVGYLAKSDVTVMGGYYWPSYPFG